MKLIFTSYGIDEPVAKQIESLLQKIRTTVKVAIITDAKKYLAKEDFTESIAKNTKYIRDLGFIKISHFSFQDYEKLDIREELEEFDLVYLFGGNSFYLLKKIKEFQFDEVLRELAEEGKVIVGQSAGSVILGPSIEIAENDFAGDDNFIGLKDFIGLRLVDFAVFPHYENSFRQNIKKLSIGIGYGIYGIKNGEAIIFNGGKISFIGHPFLFSE